METSRSDIRIPETATDEEAAAIIAAIDQLRAEEAAAEPTDSWSGRRWWFAARLENVTGKSGRACDGTPVDPWQAASRMNRL